MLTDMVVQSRVESKTVQALVERVRARRHLPAPTERRAIRERAGVSLREAGAALGVSHAAVSRWERGSTPRQHAAAYAQLLDELRRLIPEMREAGFPASDLSPTTNVDGHDTAA
jgi:DNA-binding transcriptional regulator YiaG